MHRQKKLRRMASEARKRLIVSTEKGGMFASRYPAVLGIRCNHTLRVACGEIARKNERRSATLISQCKWQGFDGTLSRARNRIATTLVTPDTCASIGRRSNYPAFRDDIWSNYVLQNGQ